MQNVRIVQLPAMKAAYSGPLTDGEKFAAFNNWFSAYHASLTNELYPRDFMWYNERVGAQEWFYALPTGVKEEDCGGFEIVDLPSGLFAVASCMDADLDDAADWMDTRAQLLKWATENPRFKPYENSAGKKERYPMFHIVSPGEMYAEKISIEDMYFPIERR
nr:GyrI-like domain-containing protein [Clostridia bacterium]